MSDPTYHRRGAIHIPESVLADGMRNANLDTLRGEQAAAQKERRDRIRMALWSALALGGGCLGIVAVGACIAAVCALFVRVFLAVLG